VCHLRLRLLKLCLTQLYDRRKSEPVTRLGEGEALIGLVEQAGSDAEPGEGGVGVQPCGLHVAHDAVPEGARLFRIRLCAQTSLLRLCRVEEAVEEGNLQVCTDGAVPGGDVVVVRPYGGGADGADGGERGKHLVALGAAVFLLRLAAEVQRAQVRPLLEPLLAGKSLGVLSESGCPGVADPGALAVRLAHELNIAVVPLVGPSSILLSLMASGLNGQRFAFQGYLPIDAKEGARAIHDLEKESRIKNQTQIAIETPYRNKTLFQNLVRNLSDATLLTVAINVTGADERIKTIPVRQWKKENPELPKLPTVFLFLAN